MQKNTNVLYVGLWWLFLQGAVEWFVRRGVAITHRPVIVLAFAAEARTVPHHRARLSKAYQSARAESALFGK